jgi:hypothetical protein
MDGSLAIGKVVLYRLHYFYGVIINEKLMKSLYITRRVSYGML